MISATVRAMAGLRAHPSNSRAIGTEARPRDQQAIRLRTGRQWCTRRPSSFAHRLRPSERAARPARRVRGRGILNRVARPSQLAFAENRAMTLNEGTFDRVLRVALGIVLLSLLFFGPRTGWGLLGLIPLLTGVVGFCPLYRLIGVRTCAVNR
jgi:hypothetical protein